MNETRKQKIAFYYRNKLPNFGLFIDNIWDPHNVSAITRSADGLGVSTFYLYYTYNQFPNLKNVGKKSSSSANKWILFERVTNLLTFVQQKKSEGYKFYGCDLCPTAVSLTSFIFPEKCILILGSESKGIAPEVRQICDGFLSIPMAGMVESYNVSVAAGILMYEAYRQRGLNLKVKEVHRERSNKKDS